MFDVKILRNILLSYALPFVNLVRDDKNRRCRSNTQFIFENGTVTNQ